MHLFVDRLTPPEITIQGEDFIHLVRVLRLQQGHRLTVVALEENTYASCLVVSIQKRDMRLRAQDIFPKPKRTLPEITLVQAVVKKQKMDFILQKATELGISRIIPIYTRYTVPDSVNLARWKVIVREASMQSRRWEVPTLEEPIELKDFLKNREQITQLICFTETSAHESLKVALTRFIETPEKLLVAIGPEGGWADTERALIGGTGARLVSFGQTILRSETATIAVLGVLRWYFEGLQPPPRNDMIKPG